MRRIGKSRLVLAGILIAVMVPIVPVFAADYSVGVEVGDWVRYEVDAAWNGTSSSAPEWARYDWVKMIVESVSGTDVTVLANIHYKDGKVENNTLSWNIETGGEMWIISADLEKGDPIAVGADWIINDTTTRTYAGASRSVNFLSISQSSGESIVNATFYWDQATGVLLETSSNKTSPTENWMLRYTAVETSLWGPVPLLLAAQLSSDAVTQGDAVTISATVEDEGGTPVEGATVTATVGDLEVLILLSDQGNGAYQGTIDTSILREGTHEITVTAEKEGYRSAQVSLILTVETLRLRLTMQLSSEIITRGDIITVSATVRDVAGNPIEGATVTVYIGDKAVDLSDQGNGYYEVDVPTSDVEEGTYTVNLAVHKEGCEPDETSGTLAVEIRRLQVTVQLSTDIATQGDIVAISATVRDLTENPIEGATVAATIGLKTVMLSDQGSGIYQGNIDTFDISEGPTLSV